MPLSKPTIQFGALIHNLPEAEQAVSNSLTRLSKGFKQKSKDRMAAGPHTGRTYEKRSGAGFRRLHRASARGERPAPDTFALTNALEDNKIDPFNHEVFVNDSAAPYGKYLQSEKMERKIITPEDGQEYIQAEGKQEVDDLTKKLFG